MDDGTLIVLNWLFLIGALIILVISLIFLITQCYKLPSSLRILRRLRDMDEELDETVDSD